MTERTSNLIAGLCGILAILGAEIAFFAIVGATPEMGAATDTINDFLTRSSTRVYGGGYVEVLACTLCASCALIGRAQRKFPGRVSVS
jgi:hypothetical protein